MSTSTADQRASNLLLGIMSGRKGGRLLPADFMALVVERVGGAEKLAQIVANILNDPKVPAVAKQRTLSDLMRTMQHVEVKSAPAADLTQFSTQDLKAALVDLVGQLEQADGQAPAETVVNGSEADPGQPGP